MTIAPVRSTDSQQLIAESTEELLAQADGVPEARRQELLDEVILLNAPVARSIASRYRRKGVDADDLEPDSGPAPRRPRLPTPNSPLHRRICPLCRRASPPCDKSERPLSHR